MSERLSLVSGRQVVTALQRIGYYIRRQKGSHVRLYHPNRLPVTVPDHKEIDRKTFKSILRITNLTPEKFNSLL